MSIISSRCALSHQVSDITSLITLWIRVGLLQRVPSVPVYIQIMLNVLHPSTEGLRGPAERWDPWHLPWFAAQAKTWKNVQSDHASAEACLRTEGSAASCSETRLAGNPGGGALTPYWRETKGEDQRPDHFEGDKLDSRWHQWLLWRLFRVLSLASSLQHV